jgi:hypothetical protein
MNDLFEYFTVIADNTQNEKEVSNYFYKFKYALSLLPATGSAGFIKRFMEESDEEFPTYKWLKRLVK